MKNFITVSLLLVGSIATYNALPSTSSSASEEDFVDNYDRVPPYTRTPTLPPGFEKLMTALTSNDFEEIFRYGLDEKKLTQVLLLSPPFQRLVESNNFVRLIETQCTEKTGSDRLLKDMSTAVAAIPACVVSKMEDVVGFANAVKNLRNSTRHRLVPKYCPEIPKAHSCFDDLMKLYSQCLDDGEAPMQLGMYDALPEALEVICKNGAELLFPKESRLYRFFIKHSSEEVEESDECKDLDAKYNMRVPSNGETREFCEGMTKRRDCAQRVINEAKDPRMMELYNVFYRAAWNKTPCSIRS